MEEDYHNKNWSVEDFERYHSGKMPDREMHALERAALDDPFLEDALEGYAFTKTAVADIEELRNKLAPVRKQTKILWYKQKGTTQFFKIAAVLVVFLGFAWMLNINRKEKKDEIASVSQIATPVNKIAADSPVPLSNKVSEVPGQVSTKDVEKISKEPVASIKKQESTESVPEQMVALAPASAFSDSQEAKRDIATIENIKLSSGERSATAPPVVRQALEANARGVVITNQNTIRGRVVDDAGNPVAFANINDKQNNLMLAADKDGYFTLNNRANTPNVKVDVNAIGFETNNAALSASNMENKIVLKESNLALSEVVITGNGSRKKSSVGAVPQKFEKDLTGIPNNKITLVNALPIAGWQSFNRFINDSLYYKKLPESGYREVVLQFNIDSLGKAQNITVKKSVSDSLDAAAKQMMQSIPALKKIKKGKTAEAIIRL